MNEPAPLLEVRELRTHFTTDQGVVRAVDGVSFALQPGEALGIVGESGSGKSVTALSIMRLLEQDAEIVGGEIVFRGRNVVTLRGQELRQLRGGDVAMIFQDPMTSLNPVRRISTQLVEALLVHGRYTKKSALGRAVALLGRMGIARPERVVHNYPHEFSGGMRQRVMLAMGFGNEPSLLIADEPTTALDVTIQAQILNLLRELVAEEDAALIMITHDLGVVAGMCERVNVMYAGMFVETGEAEQLFARPRHPYTLGLLQSVPRLDAGRRQKLQPIEGAPRDMLTAPRACPFAPRCRFEVEQSRQEVPRLEEIEPGHRVACFNPVPADEWEQTRVATSA